MTFQILEFHKCRGCGDPIPEHLKDAKLCAKCKRKARSAPPRKRKVSRAR